MKRKSVIAVLLSAVMFAQMVPAATVKAEEDAFVQKLHSMYDELEIEYRPDVRWWLAEGLNTDETLKKNLQEIYDSGFGAVEILAMPEPGADSSIYGWGSEEWAADTQLVVKEATKLGLGFALTSGTNWANANLPDTYTWDGMLFTPDNKAASKELDYSTILLKSGEAFNDTLPYPKNPGEEEPAYTEQVFQGVVAAKLLTPREESGQDFDYAEGLETGVLDPNSLVDLTESVVEEDGVYKLNWSAPDDGEYAIFTYWMHGTGQTADPSVSTNYTVNYIDTYGIEAMIDYWEENILTDELKEAIIENGRGEIYMDSLELSSYGAGGIFWGYNFKEEFKTRMGYDITPYLPLITAKSTQVWGGSGSTYDYTVEGDENLDLVEKVQNDYYEVRTDLYEENVLKPLQEWLHSLGMTLRAEPSYGQTLEISTPAKYLDGVEIESLEHRADIEFYRGLLGTANMNDLPLSSETGAIGGYNYLVDMDNWTQLCYMQFAEGVSRTVFHGYSAIEGSEEDTYWPGHEGMYAIWSERFNSRQPASEHYQDWTEMLTRNQKVLRQGTMKRDVAILRTDYQFMASPDPDSDNFMDNRMLRDETLYWNDLSLQNAGYTYDYFSPMLLNDEDVSWTDSELQPDGPGYKALILYQETIDIDSAERILEIAKDGLPIVFVNNTTEVKAIQKPLVEHETAASRSSTLKTEDEDILAIVEEIKALDNVCVVDSAEDAMPALQEMGVYPRVAYEEANDKILTVSRYDEENEIFYTFVYSYKHTDENDEPYTFTLNMEYEGAPYYLDDWTGDVSRLGVYEIQDGHTSLELSLEPGEAKIIALDLSNSEQGSFVENETRTEGDVIALTKWDITVEDWNEGDKVVNTEEKFGHTTTEVYYETRKTSLEFKDSELMAWKDLPATEEQLESLGYEGASMEHVSGIGTYETTFTLPDDWSEGDGAYLKMESAGGGTVAVWVNGEKSKAVNTRTLTVDISELVKSGENEIKIEVTSTLTNRMNQRNYVELGSYWGGFAGGWSEEYPDIKSYGLMGTVEIIPYTV